MTAGLVQYGAKQLFVEDTEGDKPTVLFIHGLGGTTTFYDPIVPLLAERFRLVRFDLEGHGRSPRSGELSVASFAADAAAVIEGLPGKKAHIVAHSLGTLVTQQLAAARPELVASLVLVGPVRAQTDAAKSATRARAATVREKGMPAVAESIATNATAADARSANPLVLGTIRELLLGQDAESYALACEALAAAENPDLSRISAPVLLLAGTEDKLSSAAVLAELQAALPGTRSATTPKCGHWTVTEAPDFVGRQILEFIASQRSDQ